MTFVDAGNNTDATFYFMDGGSTTLEGINYADLTAANFVFKPAAHPLEGGIGNDAINGTSDDEVIAGYAGNDTINGSGGNDTIYGGGGDDTIHGGAGNDLINGQDGSDHLYGDDGNDTLIGGDASDFSADFFTGGQGDDVIIGGTHDGEANRVQYLYEDGTDGVIVNLSDGAVTGITDVTGQSASSIAAGTAFDTYGNTDTLSFIENVDGTNQNDYIVGNGEDNELVGYDGNDYLEGGDGSDHLVGGDGNDTLVGGGASDFSDDFFTGGQGNDLIIGGTHLHEFNRVQYRSEDGPNGVIVNLSSHDVSGIAGVDGQTATTIAAGTALDTYGSTDTFQFVANMDGTARADYMVAADEGSDFAGYEGNDTFVAGNGFDDVNYFSETRGNVDDGTKGVVINLGGGVLTVTSDLAAATGQAEGVVAAGTGLDSYGYTDTFLNAAWGTGFQDIGGTRFNDYLVSAGNPDGPDNGNQLTGYEGNDTLVGSATADDVVDYGREVREVDNDGVRGTRGVIVNLSGEMLSGLSGVATGQTADTLAAGQALDSFGDTDTLVNIDGIRGTDFNDYIIMPSVSVPGADVFVDAGAGDDYVDIGAGNSHVLGGDGNDTLIGGNGSNGQSNFFDPGAGNDIIIDTGNGQGEYDNLEYYNATEAITVDKTSASSGTVDGGASVGHDVFSGIEIVIGGDQADTFNGSSDNDDFTGNAGNDTFNGGGGFDTVNYSKEQYDQNQSGIEGVIVNLSSSALAVGGALQAATGQTVTSVAAGHAIDSFGDIDTLNSIEGIITGYANDYVALGNSNGLVLSAAGDDTLIGGAGNDTFVGGAGNDSLDGGAGYNTVDYAREAYGAWADPGSRGVIVNLSGSAVTADFGGVTGQSASVIGAGTALDSFGDTDTLANIQQVEGTQYNDYLIAGDAGGFALNGHDGDDTLVGGAGPDTFNGGAGDDVILGGGLYDYISGSTGNDTIDGGSGGGWDQLAFDDDQGHTEDHVDFVLDGANSSGTVTGIYQGEAIADTVTSVEQFRGTTGADTFTVDSGFHSDPDSRGVYFDGRGDSLGGAGRVVQLTGGAGNDTFTDNTDSSTGGAGSSMVNYDEERWTHNGYSGEQWGSATGQHGVVVNLSSDPLTVNFDLNDGSGPQPISVASGTAFDTFGDTDSFSGVNTFRLTDAADVFQGSDAAAYVESQDGNDTLVGGSGNDNFVAGSGDDSVAGGLGNDSLDGGLGNDTVSGGAGNDQIHDSLGSDVIDGGSGYDVVYVEQGNAASGGGVSFTFSGSNGAGTAVGTATENDYEGGQNTGALDTSFSNVELVLGSTGADQFTVEAGFANTAEAFTDNIGGRSIGPAMQVIGGAGDDSFADNGGALLVDYHMEAFAHTDYDGHTWGTQPGEHGVFVNLSGSSQTAQFDAGSGVQSTSVAAQSAIDTYGDTDTFTDVLAVTLTDANDVAYADDTRGTTIYGYGGDDLITGGAGDDNLVGGDGNDTLSGGTGANILVGGAGNDTFILGAAGTATITDFTAGGTDDAVDLTAIAGVNSFADVLAHLDDTGNTTDAAFTFGATHLVLQGVDWRTLTAGDFLVTTVAGVVINGSNGADTVDAYHTPAGQPLPGAGDDTIFGNGGNDSLSGLGGNDSIDGGAGSDTMIGGIGNDTYVVNSAGDVIVENPNEGNDTVQASITFSLAALADVENVTLTGTGNINATGNGSNNVLVGNTGNNSLDGGAGADTMQGGAGNDTYVVDAAGDVVIENPGEGTDTIKSSLTFSLAALADIENLTLTGTDNINATGNGGNNTLVGNGGNNVIDGGAGADSMTGGAGDDTYYVDDAGDKVVEAAGGGTDTVISSVSLTLGANVENLVLAAGAGNISGTGNSLANTLTGNAGDNTLDGGAGIDTLIGNGGNDTFVVDNVGDLVTGGAGLDTVLSKVSYSIAANPEIENLTLTGTGNINATGNGSNNVLVGNTGNNSLDGGAGADTMQGGAGNDTYYVDNAGDVVDEQSNGGAGIDTVVSTISFDLSDSVHVLGDIEKLTLGGTDAINGTGNALDNTITGNAAGNVLDGGLGNDTMAGGLGNDIYYADSTGDVVTEASNAGTDTVHFTGLSGTYTLGANVENLILDGVGDTGGIGSSVDNMMIGNAGNNSLSGGAGDDTLDGGSGGSDTLTGGAGDDTYIVRHTGDVVSETGGSGIDTVESYVSFDLGNASQATGNIENVTLLGDGAISATGNALANTLIGNAGDNGLYGGAGKDTIFAGSGHDTIDGGLGHDNLFAGAGPDVFSYIDADFGGTTGTAAANSDQVFGLTGADRFDLSGLISSADIALAGGDINDAIRLTGSDGAFHIEINEGAVLHNKAAPDWSDAFDVFGSSLTDIHITAGDTGTAYHWDPLANNGHGAFVADS
ncbi:MAG: beta strand repeat-containing protein [Devosia sp.]